MIRLNDQGLLWQEFLMISISNTILYTNLPISIAYELTLKEWISFVYKIVKNWFIDEKFRLTQLYNILSTISDDEWWQSDSDGLEHK